MIQTLAKVMLQLQTAAADTCQSFILPAPSTRTYSKLLGQYWSATLDYQCQSHREMAGMGTQSWYKRCRQLDRAQSIARCINSTACVPPY